MWTVSALVGTSPVLTIDEEAKIVHHLRNMASYGYGYTRQERLQIMLYCLARGPKINHSPSTGFAASLSDGLNY